MSVDVNRVRIHVRRKLDEPIRPVITRMIFALAAAPAYLVSRYAAGNPEWAEEYTRLYLHVSRAVSPAVGLLPFSLAEFLLVFVIAAAMVLPVYRIVRHKPLKALAGLLALVSAAYSIFSLGWGISYSRLPYAQTAGLDVRERSAQELYVLCDSLISRANALRENALEDETGLYAPKLSGREQLRAIQGAYEFAATGRPWLAGRYGNPKPVLLSVPMSYLQITGIYIPYTFEANVNMNNSPWMVPVTAAHEAAHMRGWAREDEANYIAYIVCRESGEEELEYSAMMLGLIYAMNALSGVDAQGYYELSQKYCDGIRRDFDAHNAHWEKYEGKVSEAQERLNDAYLKANRQEDGVRSYGRMVDLMLAEGVW